MSLLQVYYSDRTVLHMEPPHTFCSLLLPDASKVRVSSDNPIGVAHYVDCAVQFASWAFKSPAERAEVSGVGNCPC